MKICIVVKSLAGGGAEKVAVDLANYFSDKHHVTILTLSQSEDKFIPNKSIDRIKMDLYSKSKNMFMGLFSNFNRIISIRKVIVANKPDVVISFMNRTNIRVLISLLYSKIPVVITEHNYPENNPMSKNWEFLRKIIYKKAFVLVSVSQGISDWFKFLPTEKKEVIYNPAFIKINKSKDICLDLTKKNIVSMGRLVEIKGFDLLINAFSRISMLTPEWNLSIIGDGKLYDKLNKLIIKNNLTDRVSLLGFKPEPHNILEKADLFVLCSKSEGLGNVIIESMKCGVPVLSTDCPVGPKELIENNITGILVKNDDVKALSEGLLYLINNEAKRIELKTNALIKVEEFSNESIFSKWDQLLEKIEGK